MYHTSNVIGFLGMQDFDFCPNRIKLYLIHPNFTQFIQILPIYSHLPTLYPNLLKLA